MRYNEIATYTGLAVTYVFSELLVREIQKSPDYFLLFLGRMCLFTPITSFLNSIDNYNADIRYNQGNEFHKTLMPPLGTFLHSTIYGTFHQIFSLFRATIYAYCTCASPDMRELVLGRPLDLAIPIIFNLLALRKCKLFMSLIS